MLSKIALKALLLSNRSLKYDRSLGLLVEDGETKRTWLVPFGLANRAWPASPDSPVVLEQTLHDGVWRHDRAWRLRDELPVEPPFPSSGRCWAITGQEDVVNGDVLYAFSCRATAQAALDSVPHHLAPAMRLVEVLTKTPWVAPYKAHTVEPLY